MSLQLFFFFKFWKENLPEVQLTSVPEFLRDLQLEFTTLSFICPKNFISSTVGLTDGGHLKMVGHIFRQLTSSLCPWRRLLEN